MLKKLTSQVILFAAATVSNSVQAGSYDDFFTAITRDNPTEITELLRRGFDVNSRSTKGQVGLFEALQKDSQKAVVALLESDALDVNALNDKGESVLMMAALKGKVELCELLIKRGAKVNKEGWTPLHYAATGPEPKTVSLLLARGAELEAESPNKNTALMMAVRFGPEASVDLLLAQGADLTRVNAGGWNAVELAANVGREVLSKRLAALPAK
jgi:uncharacterized protein